MDGTSWRKIAVWTAALAALAGVVFATVLMIRARQRKSRPILLRGAVVKQSDDTKNQSPIADVEVNAANGLAVRPVKTDFSGSFVLALRPEVVAGQPVTLTFRH